MVFKTPLNWPQGTPRAKSRKDALFSKKNYSTGRVTSLSIYEATKRLSEELARHGVRNFDEDVVISSNLKVAAGGMARSDQPEPADPGVSVYWETRDGKSRNMAIDIYTRAADNMAAVAATLDAMRAIERHGGKAVQDKAFSGFDALPAPDSCWQILNMHLLPEHQRTKETVVERFKEQATKPVDHRGMPIDMGALVKARDEALAKIRGE